MGGTPLLRDAYPFRRCRLSEAGETINDFLEGFPSVTREQVVAFLEEAKDRLVESVP
jgi:hypothetical protein